MATTSTPTAYADDVLTWSKEQAAALRRMAVTRVNLQEPVDVLNLAEEIESLLRLNPGPQPHRDEALHGAWRTARRQAAYQTRLALRTFPETCPFTVEEVECEEFWG